MIKIGNYFLNLNIEIGAGGIYSSLNDVKGDIFIVIPNVIDFFQFRWEKDCTLAEFNF